MKVMLIGSGGREHALAWKISQSASMDKLYAVPGNPGIEEIARLVPYDVTDIDKIAMFAAEESIDLVVVGPEVPLALGLADALAVRKIPCFGPGAKGALLESSKKYARDFMARYDLPSPKWRAFSSLQDAGIYLTTLPDAPVVIKADGLAQGKGVVVAQDRLDAFSALEEIMDSGKFGQAGEEVLVEECLFGEEVSLLVFSDGKKLLPMIPSQDHKRAGDGDTGENTGGMGAYAPVSAYTPEIAEVVERTIIKPIEKAFRGEGIDYRGCLYIGLMLTADGPKIIEFNARFGDPETQAILPLLKSDLLGVLYACALGDLGDTKLEWSDGAAACVVVASMGYPAKYKTGQLITNDESKNAPLAGGCAHPTMVFHAGTAWNKNHELVTNGGRVFGVASAGATIKEALDNIYARIDGIHFDGLAFRKDIGHRELSRLGQYNDKRANRRLS
ncbi:phosphoribosylamine--glycine ligase [Synergistales bacterium]|nr:phosphoribosylamine--glycine ligase [Synergistales bacterium]